MAAVGEAVARVEKGDALVRAKERAALLPDLLIEARRVVSTVISGWHGRRKRGIGENFWQFRPYVEGESLARIDWRRSARDDHIYVRDREWEAAHTVWLWADGSSSMLFRSTASDVAKESRALVLVLALAELLSRSGERIGYPGVMNPVGARNGAERLASALIHGEAAAGLPDISAVRRFADIVIASDFLAPMDEILDLMQSLADRGARAHLIEIVDPAEENFPYAGRTEFRDPETGETITAGRAETFAEEYRRLFVARRETLAERCRRYGWSFTTNWTDRPASEALIHVHLNMTAEAGDFGRGVT
jgi:uncharacterized protein (DUF58 family)